jgi:hypothetical protein
MSQTFPAGSDVKYIFGMRRSNQYRLNIGVLNPAATVIPGTGGGVAFVVVTDVGGGAGDWQTWGSSVDNQSGDAWSRMGFARP